MKRKLSATRFGKDNPFFGKKHTEEARKKMGDPSRGKPQSEEHKRKRAEAVSGENNGNYGKTPWLGRTHTDLTKAQISLSQLQDYEKNPERREDVSKEMHENWSNPKVAKKMLKGLEKARANSPVLQKGHKLSEETKRKISEAAKRRHAAA
jgi:hypothetical protein